MKRLFPALLAAGVLVAGSVAALNPGEPRTRITAHFRSVAGLHPGSDVRILGVKVGEVLSVRPEGATARVVLAYERRTPAPADAVAVVVQPTLAGERYVQLAPAYRKGPVLPPGAELPVSRTATPVELDDVARGLGDLGAALGPEGANATGSLSRLVTTARRNLQGNGDTLNQTIEDVSRLASAAADGREDLFATVGDLQKVTATLAAGDGQVRAFSDDLAAVSRTLDGEKDELTAAIRTLSFALAQLSQFVRENGAALASNVQALGELSAVLVRQRDALATFLDLAPTALANLEQAHDPATGALAIRNTGSDPVATICRALSALPARQVPDGCAALPGILPGVLPGGRILARAPAAASTGVRLDSTLAGILGGQR